MRNTGPTGRREAEALTGNRDIATGDPPQAGDRRRNRELVKAYSLEEQAV